MKSNWYILSKKFFEKHNWLITLIVTIVLTIIGWIYFSSKETTQWNYWDNNTQINNPVWTVNISYTNSKDPNYLNPRSKNLIWLSPIKLSYLYFELQNNNKYDEACSLLVKRKRNIWCNVIDGDQVSDFATEVKKYDWWYQNISIKPLNWNEYDQTICIKYSYLLKSDAKPSKIREIYSYDWEKRKDWERELVSRVCEWKYKEWVWRRPCPIETNNKRCLEIMK